MARLVFIKGEQCKWLNTAIVKSNLNAEEFAVLCKVSSRTIRDWKREKFLIPEKVAELINIKCDLGLPSNITKIDEYWYVTKGARLGGLKRHKLYGLLGDIESRRKGGLISQSNRKQNPVKYKLLGCNVRKEFIPIKKSSQFAEMTGIILGDGGITDNQLTVTLDRVTDSDYIPYVRNLSQIVFGEMFKKNYRKHDRGVDLCLSGINLIENLYKFQLTKGDKIARQINFPVWIWDKIIYQRLCVRGLIDTDGCVFIHRHKVGTTTYQHLRISFSSKSHPLLDSISKVLDIEKIKHYVSHKFGTINIYDLSHIKKYVKKIGFSNLKHINKYQTYLMYNQQIGSNKLEESDSGSFHRLGKSAA